MTESTEKRLPPESNFFLLFCALGFLGGCVLCGSLVMGPWLWIVAALCIALGVVFHFLGKSPLIPFVILFFLFGLLRTQPALNPAHPDPGKYEITASVCGNAVAGDGKLKMVLRDISLDGKPVPGKAYFTLTTRYLKESPSDPFDGARIRFEGRVYLPEGKSGEPHFDFQRWMLTEGYSFGISAYSAYTLENTPETAPVMDLSSRIRNAVQDRLEIIMGKEASVAMAVLFGDKTGLTDEEYDAFKRLGMAHLMSVSGLHIGIMAAMLSRLLELTHLRRKFRLPILMLFLFGYSTLCGFSASSQRAAIMFSVIFIAKLFDRARDRLSILALAALIILLVNPLEAGSAGFVLSFSAMLGIYGFTSLFQELWSRLWPIGHKEHDKGWKGKLKQFYRSFAQGFQSLFSLSLGAQIGTLLPTICFFHQLPTYGLLMNLLLAPLVASVLTPFYFCVSLLCYVPWLSGFLGSCASLMTKGLLGAVQWLGQLPGAMIRVAVPGIALGIGIVLFLLLLSRLTPGRTLPKAGIAALVLLVSIGVNLLMRPAPLRFIQLSAGQADSAILLDGRKTVVIDTGEEGGELLDYLLYEGRSIDELYITHPHLDHIGGVQKLLEEGIRIGQIYLPEGYQRMDIGKDVQRILDEIAMQGIPVTELHAGEERSYDQSSIRVLWPYAGKIRTGTDANQGSLVLFIQLGDYSLLNMGDLGSEYEDYVGIPANLLKVAHHGSSGSTSETFLKTVHPDYAFVSCSSSDSRLPSPKTLNRISAQSIPLLRTDAAGDITVSVKNQKLLIQPYRGETLP